MRVRRPASDVDPGLTKPYIPPMEREAQRTHTGLEPDDGWSVSKAKLDAVNIAASTRDLFFRGNRLSRRTRVG
jgi:hypothetical protein